MKLINTGYSFACAYLKGEEARCFSSEHLDGMLQRAATVKEALENIKNTDLGEYLLEQPLNKIDEVDGELWEYLRICRDRLGKFNLPGDMFLLMERYLRKYDILNIKIALRKVVSRESLPPAPMGTIYELGYLDELMLAETVKDINDILVKADLLDYADVLGGIKDIDRRSLIEGETELDNRYFNHLFQAMASMIDGGILTMAASVLVDATNLSILFRSVLKEKPDSSGIFFLQGGQVFTENALRELMSMKPIEIAAKLEGTDYELVAQDITKLYEKTGMISAVDRVVEKQKFVLLRELLSPRALSPCNLLWYFLIKELEIRNVRLLMKTSFDGVSPSETRDYVVMVS